MERCLSIPMIGTANLFCRVLANKSESGITSPLVKQLNCHAVQNRDTNSAQRYELPNFTGTIVIVTISSFIRLPIPWSREQTSLRNFQNCKWELKMYRNVIKMWADYCTVSRISGLGILVLVPQSHCLYPLETLIWKIYQKHPWSLSRRLRRSTNG